MFCGDFWDKTFRLAVSGNVKALAEYFRSFGPYAVFGQFFHRCSDQHGKYLSVCLHIDSERLDFRPAFGNCHFLAGGKRSALSSVFLLMRFFFRNTAERVIRKANKLESHRPGQRKERHCVDDFCPRTAVFSFRNF
jgi:hypothetical protein